MRKSLFSILVVISLIGLACSEDSDEVTGGGDEQPSNIIRVPQAQPTIQAGIDAAGPGDTVLVADGVYRGVGNQDITFGGKSLVVLSENGPHHTIIDIEAAEDNLHFGFQLTQTGETAVTIDGFTIRGAYGSQGSAIKMRSVNPTIKNCIFSRNSATTSGGAVRCKASSPTFENCTFVDNQAPTGSVAYLLASAMPQFINCILANSSGGEVIVCSSDDELPVFNCSNIYGNAGGDWVGCISVMLSTAGNMSSDPLFCNESTNDFHLEPGSPCAPDNSGCGVLVGALGTGCSQ